MKRKLRLMMTMLLLAVMGSAWAVTKSVEISPTQALNEGGVTPITIVCEKGDGTSNPAISGGQLRLYQAASGKSTGNTITFSSTKTITSIVFTFASNMTADNGVFSDGNYDSSTRTWTGSTNSVTLTVTGTSGSTRIYITSLVVYYEDDNVATSYTVTYDCNGGTSGCPNDLSDVTGDTEITLPNAPTREGFTFNGWSDGTTIYQSGDTYTVTSDVTFIAQWVQNPVVGGEEWILTDIADLTADDVFVIVGNNGSNLAMTNNNGTGSAPGASAVTVTGNKITSVVADNLKWNISGDATNGYTFYPNGSTASWLYCTNSNNGVRVGTNANKAFTINSGYLYNTATSRYVGIYNSQDWRCYTSINSNIQNQSFSFYKKVSDEVIISKPTFSLEDGTYNEVKSVTISCATQGATIYYTTDGTDPTENSTSYTGPVTVGKSMTLKAIAVLDGNSSTVATAEYIIKVATPVFDPIATTYSEAQSVTISSATEGATIYYTTDGTTPTTSSTPYSGAISVTETTTIKAIAVYGEMDNSEVATATYIIKVPIEGVFVKATSEDELEAGMQVIIVNDEYDKVMGSQGSNNFGTAAVTIDSDANPWEATLEDEDNTTILTLIGEPNAWYFKDENNKYLYAASSSSNHLKTQDEQNDDAKATISISGDNSNATITFQGTNSRNVLMYNNSSNLFSCYASTSTMKPVQIYYLSQLAKPTITPGTGEYTEDQTVTITSIEGATIYYTTDGTTPTTSSAVYTEPFTVSETTTIMAIAVKDGKTSSVATATLTFVLTPPVISPESSEQDGTYQVTITAPRGTIYYIEQTKMIYLDLETGYPTETNTGVLNPAAVAYSGALTYSQPMMVTAVAVDANGNISNATTAIYTYTGTVTPPYYETFSDYSGGFTSENETNGPEWRIRSNTGSEAIARWGEERHYEYVSGTSANTYAHTIHRYYGTADLISPIINLTDVTDPSFFFIHAGHGFYSDPNTSATTNTGLETTLNDEVAKVSCKVYVGVSDESGNVASWNQIPWGEGGATFFTQKFLANAYTNDDCTVTSSTESRGGQFIRVNSGEISLDEYVGNYIRIKFEYTSDNEHYGTWNVDKFQVNASKTEKIEMNAKGWTTYVIDHDIDAYQTTQNYDGNLEIFKVTEFDQSTAVLQQLGFVENHDASTDDSERYLPAKTPIVVHGPAGQEIDLVIYQSPEVLVQVKNNLLHGSLAPNLATPTAGVRYFILQMKDGESLPYFNRLKEGRSVPDHKAYLNGDQQTEAVTSQTNAAKGLFVMRDLENGNTVVSEDGGFIDGIQTVSGESINNEWFTISGVRVNRPTKGVYIMNGKKVVIK